MRYTKYKKTLDYSYTLGAYPTINMLENYPDSGIVIFISDSASEKKSDLVKALAASKGIRVEEHANKIVSKLREKDSISIVGVFKKFEKNLEDNANHIVLVNPSNLGNLGTIMRSAISFSYRNIAIISPAVDVYNPSLVRSSMGAIFNLKFKYYENIESYLSEFKSREIYTFMLNSATYLDEMSIKEVGKHSLIFGNESSGLDETYNNIGKPLKIRQTDIEDSLNLSIAASIAMYSFYKG